MLTKTCKRGHALTPSNIYWAKPGGKKGYYICKRCKMLSNQKYRRKNKIRREDYAKEYRARPVNREKARQYAAAYREKTQHGQEKSNAQA